MRSHFRTTALAAIASLGIAHAGHAQEALTPEVAMIYAAFAKLEANIQETALLVELSAVMTDDMVDARANLVSEYASDVDKVARYVRVLRRASLTDAQIAVLDDFEGRWADVTAHGLSLMQNASDTPEYRKAALDYWFMIDGIDDLIDDKLEEMRERYDFDWTSDPA